MAPGFPLCTPSLFFYKRLLYVSYRSIHIKKALLLYNSHKFENMCEKRFTTQLKFTKILGPVLKRNARLLVAQLVENLPEMHETRV